MEIIEKVKLHVIGLFERHPKQQLGFHTLEHTLSVVRSAETIGRAEGLSDAEMTALLLSAWFCHTGCLLDPGPHDGDSVPVARDFFNLNPVDETLSRRVIDALTVIGRQTSPANPIEQAMADANVAWMAGENVIPISKKLRKERANGGGDVTNYWGETLVSLKALAFRTNYAKANFAEPLARNVRLVEEQIILEAAKRAKTDDTRRIPEKGVESMFRLTASNQMRLSAIADKKANILISINSALISLTALAASRQLVSIQGLFPAVVILFTSSLLSLVFAILSCRPELKRPDVNDQDLEQRKVNLLFFGSFFRIPFPKYEQAVRDMMADYDYLYGNLIKDQYYLGQSLFRKYKLLRTAYNVFMAGFILSAVVFVVSYLFLK